MEALGEVTVYDRTKPEEVVERIGDAEVVYTNKTPITRDTLDQCGNIRFIGVLATGYNIIDIEAAKEKGIPVSNIPTYGTAAVSQFAIALLLELCHHIGEHSDAVKNGEWTSNPDWCFWKYPLVELAGKTMGIVGFGRIGQDTGKIAQALGMKVLAFDAYKRPEPGERDLPLRRPGYAACRVGRDLSSLPVIPGYRRHHQQGYDCQDEDRSHDHQRFQRAADRRRGLKGCA